MLLLLRQLSNEASSEIGVQRIVASYLSLVMPFTVLGSREIPSQVGVLQVVVRTVPTLDVSDSRDAPVVMLPARAVAGISGWLWASPLGSTAFVQAMPQSIGTGRLAGLSPWL